jgi:ubiquinone biosynthesis protein
LKEVRDLCVGFRHELDLSRERAVIERVHDKLKAKRQKALVIPKVNAAFCTPRVLCVERFRGVSLAAVVAGEAAVPAAVRAKLARSMLSELLVQVFELGLFHADPHAGNLILLESGAVGLFDWGLAGELTDADRRHIAAILKAVLALDVERLVDALQEMGPGIDRAAIRKELASVVKLIKRGEANPAQKASMQQLFEACLKGAARLGIVVPDGLLLMVKSLVTIEGLARGIDPKVSLARIATPVLFRAAKPNLGDVLNLSKRLPALAKAIWGK